MYGQEQLLRNLRNIKAMVMKDDFLERYWDNECCGIFTFAIAAIFLKLLKILIWLLIYWQPSWIFSMSANILFIWNVNVLSDRQKFKLSCDI